MGQWSETARERRLQQPRGGGLPQAVWIGASSRKDAGQFGAEKSIPMIWAKTKLAFLTPSSRKPLVDLEIFPGKNQHS